MSEEEEKNFNSACVKDGKSNPFCFFVVNRDALEDKFKDSLIPESRPKRMPRVRPKFLGGKVSNWKDLKASTVNNLIKVLNRLSRAKMKMLSGMAIQETQCPDNPAVAIAATLEDRLPAGEDIGELALLYEKGGDCLTDPDDKENALTRAGLFYYVKHDLSKAIPVLQRSASVEAAKSPRPLYWLYRAQIESADKMGAQNTLNRLKEKYPFSYHAIMARLADKEDPDDILLRSVPNSLTRSQKKLSVNPMLEAVESLRQMGFNRSAAKILDWAIVEAAEAEPELKIYLAELKAEQEDLHSILFLLSKVLLDNPNLVTRKTLALYFPKAYFPLFEKHSAGLDPYLLLAIARQESAFNAKAISTAKAKGLLQIQAKGKKRRGNLLDPESNIKMGASLFALLLRQNEGKLHLALAAYNAGPKRIDTWVKRYPIQDPILFTDLIPFKETRTYVALILRNYYWYRRIHSPIDKKLPWLGLRDQTSEYSPDRSTSAF
jgi:soluble lytic murein transglycosylase